MVTHVLQVTRLSEEGGNRNPGFPARFSIFRPMFSFDGYYPTKEKKKTFSDCVLEDTLCLENINLFAIAKSSASISHFSAVCLLLC